MKHITHNIKQFCSMFHAPCSMQKGVSLLFVVLIMSVILSVALGVSGILLQETKIVGKIGHSVVSFYAADSGVERELYELYKAPLGLPRSVFSNMAVGKASYTVQTKCSPENADCPSSFGSPDETCEALNYCLKSIGTFEQTKRAISIKY